LRRWASQGQGSLWQFKSAKAAIPLQQKLIVMITAKEGQQLVLLDRVFAAF